MLVTFDLFSALIDSRAGGSASFARLAHDRAWAISGECLYDDWDARSKASQRDLVEWVPFADHCRWALAATYAGLGLTADADADVEILLSSLKDWPLWPDVAAGLPALAVRHRVGILSNVDDDLLARTKIAGLLAENNNLFTSQRLGAYKPSTQIYRRARERAGGEFVHVAASSRDVRGALEAGIGVIRLRRPGHRLDPGGPEPPVEVDDIAGVRVALDDRRRPWRAVR